METNEIVTGCETISDGSRRQESEVNLMKMKSIIETLRDPIFIICVILDLIDFILPPGVEIPWDIFLTFLALLFFRLKGLFAFWEVPELTSMDRFVPTMTVLYFWNKSGKSLWQLLGFKGKQLSGPKNKGSQ